LIIDHQNICRLQLALHQALGVKESQGIQDGREHLLYFVGSKGPLQEDLRERLFGVFHYDEKELAASELAQTRVEKANQVRMR